jgi:hypothetical protein
VQKNLSGKLDLGSCFKKFFKSMIKKIPKHKNLEIFFRTTVISMKGGGKILDIRLYVPKIDGPRGQVLDVSGT